jgi:hypothetical protein
MTEQLIEVYLSPQETFLVVCPHCNQSKIFKPDDLPPNSPNPFKYECPCGVSSNVLLNYRRTYRKDVKLAGSFTLPSESKKIERICTVLDISATGMQIVTDYFKNISEGQPIDATIIFDDKLRTRLELRCVVRHIIPDNARRRLRLEFVNLNPHQQQVLGAYLMP